MQKKINLFIIMLLITTLFFGFMSVPVIAWHEDDIIEWDEFPVGVTSGSSDFYTWERTTGDDGNIVTTSVNGSTKSLYFAINDAGSQEDLTSVYLDYDIDVNVENIKIHWKFNYDYNLVGEFKYYTITFYKEGVVQCLIQFRSTDIAGVESFVIRGRDANGTFFDFETDSTLKPQFNYFRHMYINFSEANDDYGDFLQYSLFNTSTGNLISTQQLTMEEWQGDWEYIDEITFKTGATDPNFGSSGYDLRVYQGDIMFDQFGYTVGEGDFDVLEWDYIGDLIPSDYVHYASVDRVYEELFNLPITCEIKAVDLLVTSHQFNDDSDLSNYKLVIGDNVPYWHAYTTAYTPVAFIPFLDNYLLRWYFVNHTINDTVITFEFYHLEANDDGVYWKWIGITPNDNDGDGDINLRYHDDIFDVNRFFDGVLLDNFDLNMRFYYTGDIYLPDPDLPDYVGIDDSPPYYTFVNIPISYSISTKEYDNYMEIWQNGNRVGEAWGFGSDGTNGLFLSDWSATVGFVPLVAGSYSVNIRRNGVNVTKYAFTVLDNPITDYYIYTIPMPSQYPHPFIVEYKYFHGEGKQGILTIHDIQTFSEPTSHLYYIYLTANTTGNFSYTPSRIYDLLYISMGIEISTGLYTLASFPNNPYLHYIKDYSTSNYIELTYPIIDLNVSHIQIVTGHHNHISSYVYITDNGEIIQDVSNKNRFTFSYTVIDSGFHKVELVLSTANGTVILDTKYYSASEGILEEPDEDEFEILGEYKLWLGVGIIVIFLLMPLGIAIKGYVDVPLIVYIAMGSIGTGISVSLGLLEVYWLLLLMVALVTGAVISKWGL